MKTLLLGLLLLSGLIFKASAQEQQQKRTPEERAQRQTEMMAEKLSLTEAQKTKVYEVNMKTMKQMQKFREANDTANVRAIRVASDAAYEKILTPEQYQQYEQIKQQRMERREGRMNRDHNNESRDN